MKPDDDEHLGDSHQSESSKDSGEVADEYEVYEQSHQEQDNTTSTTEGSDDPKSSFENIIPMNNLRNGWIHVSSFLKSTAEQIEKTATEINESERVKNFKARATEVAAPYIDKGKQTWEATKEKTAPIVKDIWDRTVIVSNSAVESAKPTVEKVTGTRYWNLLNWY